MFWHAHEKIERELEELEREGKQETAALRLLIRLALAQLALLREILAALPQPPQLAAISIRFGGNMAVGPVTLSQATPNTVATVLGFDQFGNPFPIDFTVNPVTYTLDDPSQDTLAANADGSANLTWLTPGGKTANL